MTTKVQQDYGVQPNLKKKDQSFVDFMQQTTWFTAMTKALQRHSEFMRPELGSPEQMEYAYPPLYDLPHDMGGGESEIEPGKMLCSGCHLGAMVFDGSLGSQNAQICFPYSGMICMTPEWTEMYEEWKQTGITPGGVLGEWPTLEASAAAWAGGKFTWQQIKGTPTSLQLVPPNERYWTGGYCIRPAGGTWPLDSDTTVRIMFKDVYGNKCSDTKTIYVSCCDAAGYVAMTFDDASTADTVAKNSSITVYVLNGCGPYDWTVSGAGFSLASAQTSGTSNTLTLANTNCGVHAAQAALTITDRCGTSVTAKIKAADGTWEVIGGFGVGAYCQNANCNNCGDTCGDWATSSTVYHYGVGAGGAYDARWLFEYKLGCGANPACTPVYGPWSIGSGSSCGQDTLTASEAGCSALPCCPCNGQLAYWTCGTDCT